MTRIELQGQPGDEFVIVFTDTKVLSICMSAAGVEVEG